MYLGQVVEFCRSDELYQEPLHPYTQCCWTSIPVIDPASAGRRSAQRRDPESAEPAIRLSIPHALPFAMEICATERPALRHPRRITLWRAI